MTLTLILIIITSLISWQAFSNQELFYRLMHFPYEEMRSREYYRFLTSGFLHGNLVHLAINMFVLYQFGTAVEHYFVSVFGELFGRVNYLLLYLLSGIFGDVPTYFKHRHHQGFSSVGASGAVSGIMLAFVLFNPWSMLLLFFIIPMPAFVAAILYLVYSSWASKRGGERIDHEAHFWGAVFGFCFTLALKPALLSYFLNQLVSGFPF